MNEEDKKRIKEKIETEFSIQNLDDMANMFFRIAELLGHPLKNVNLKLTKLWGEQYKENSTKSNNHNPVILRIDGVQGEGTLKIQP